ncbi:unnamed protein product [Ophioblennius macclurei]
MEGDLEDGEISGSDTEMGARPPVVPAPAVAAYRGGGGGGHRAAESSDSDPESSDEEEAAALWRRKRQKVSNTTWLDRTPVPASGAPQGRKVNNIWGSVVQEQCQDSLTAELGFFGMEGVGTSSRNVETYNYVLARKIMEKEREQEKQGKEGGEVSMLDAELEEYMKGRGSEESGGGGGDAKRKRSAKERLGPRAEMDVKGRYEITDDDDDDKVVEEIAYRLQEPKKDLIQRVIRVIGKKKAIELLGETATLEESGGVYTMDGSRRRTPGGVYLNLLKNTPSITKEQIKKIFFEEQQRDTKSKKAAQKRRRHVVAKKMKQAIGMLNLQEHDDVSRETFASDTNEALESLEETAEGAEEEEEDEERPQDAAVGAENAVVYNSADLEVF